MVIDFLRISLLVILLFVIVLDYDVPQIINTAVNQLFIALIIIFIILAVDEIVGFLVGLIFLTIYFKFYQKKINNENNKEKFTNDNSSPLNSFFDYIFNPSVPSSHPNYYSQSNSNSNPQLNSGVIPSVSNEILKSAQNNIFDDVEYNKEIKAYDNSYGGIQGLHVNNLTAFDNNYNNYSTL
jgi:uncharacterized protein YozE (UPF0346 family)